VAQSDVSLYICLLLSLFAGVLYIIYSVIHFEYLGDKDIFEMALLILKRKKPGMVAHTYNCSILVYLGG
jgi:hypothetical protein